MTTLHICVPPSDHAGVQLGGLASAGDHPVPAGLHAGRPLPAASAWASPHQWPGTYVHFLHSSFLLLLLKGICMHVRMQFFQNCTGLSLCVATRAHILNLIPQD
ncbi:hypothetical protein V5799_029927 [Amblyomma americanum]|uniref:Uncharacterized protein n=1 Tax=Amblyomma americanum TaxID=6943 RepID=A0AAQ4EPU2_AMBAM